jgi:hypothetical protein
MIPHNLGGPCGNLDLTCRQLISLACVANNTFHLWLTTTFNGSMIIPDKALQHLPPGMRDILYLIKQNAAAIYVCEPLYSGQDQINILQNNLRQHQLTPLSSNFKDVIISWYRDLLFDGYHSTDSTGTDNHLFAAYGLYPSSTEHA